MRGRVRVLKRPDLCRPRWVRPRVTQLGARSLRRVRVRRGDLQGVGCRGREDSPLGAPRRTPRQRPDVLGPSACEQPDGPHEEDRFRIQDPIPSTSKTGREVLPDASTPKPPKNTRRRAGCLNPLKLVSVAELLKRYRLRRGQSARLAECAVRSSLGCRWPGAACIDPLAPCR